MSLTVTNPRVTSQRWVRLDVLNQPLWTSPKGEEIYLRNLVIDYRQGTDGLWYSSAVRFKGVSRDGAPLTDYVEFSRYPIPEVVADLVAMYLPTNESD